MDPRSIPVRFSRLKHIGRSPAHYLSALTEQRDTRSLRKGRALHSYLLGEDSSVVVWNGRRAGKAWDAFEAEHDGQEILIPSEIAEVDGMRESLLRHERARELLFEGAPHTECEVEWTRLGRKCAGRPDVYTTDRIVELKTARTSHPDRFATQARWYHYPEQLAWYREGLIASGFGSPLQAFVVAIESSRPYPVTVFELTDRALDMADRTCRLWLERLLVCESFNEWPAYTQATVPLDAPDTEGFGLIVDGEELEVA